MPHGKTYWGDFRDGLKDGYGTIEGPRGFRQIAKFKSEKVNGYSVTKNASGKVCYSMQKDGKNVGSQMWKDHDKDEIDKDFIKMMKCRN